MNNESKRVRSIIIRYSVLFLLGLGNLFIWHNILTPLTTGVVSHVLSLFYKVIVEQGAKGVPFTMLVNGYRISLIPACIAASAFYLLTILNISTPMPPKQRIKSLIAIYSALLISNIIRIIGSITILIYGSVSLFDLTHAFLWYFGSTLLVVIIWFVNIKVFKIKEIPIYSDAMYLFKKTKR